MNSMNESIGKKIFASISKYPAVKPDGHAGPLRDTEKMFLSHSNQKLFMHVSNNPCTWLRRLSRETAFSPAKTDRLLGLLTRYGLVMAIRSGNRELYMLPGMVEAPDIGTVCLLNDPDARKMILLVQEKPGITCRGISSATGIPFSTVKRHVKRLCDAGLGETVRDGRSHRLFTTEKTEYLYQKYARRRHMFLNSLLSSMRNADLKVRIESTIGQKVMLQLRLGRESVSLLINTNPITKI